jgi:hypothetical protein
MAATSEVEMASTSTQIILSDRVLKVPSCHVVATPGLLYVRSVAERMREFATCAHSHTIRGTTGGAKQNNFRK